MRATPDDFMRLAVLYAFAVSWTTQGFQWVVMAMQRLLSKCLSSNLIPTPD
jgi:hypothetical protein